jgi:hypothetical protein
LPFGSQGRGNARLLLTWHRIQCDAIMVDVVTNITIEPPKIMVLT